jgi:hypothetical protein
VSQLLALPALLGMSTSTRPPDDHGKTATTVPSHSVRFPIRAFRCSLENEAGCTPDFIASLKWLGEKGYAFEFSLDSYSHHHTIGPDLVEEVLQCIEGVREGQDEQKRTRFIIGEW